MKKMMMTLIALLTITMSAKAMSYEQARNEALFLTDKMAYELNLTDAQYEAAYEINLDYLMGVASYDDVFGTYWERRNLDLSYILLSWQWDAFRAATYFYRPLYWDAGYWHFGIYARYPHRDYFYFGRPHFYATYRGGHSWRMNGGRSFYEGRRDHFRAPAPGHGGQHFGMRDGWDRGDYRGRGGSSTRVTGGNRGNGAGSFGNGNRGNSNRGNGGFDNRGNGNRGNSGFGNRGNNGNDGVYGNGGAGSRSTGNSGSFGNGSSGRSTIGGSRSGGSFGGNRQGSSRSTTPHSSVGTQPRVSGNTGMQQRNLPSRSTVGTSTSRSISSTPSRSVSSSRSSSSFGGSRSVSSSSRSSSVSRSSGSSSHSSGSHSSGGSHGNFGGSRSR